MARLAPGGLYYGPVFGGRGVCAHYDLPDDVLHVRGASTNAPVGIGLPAFTSLIPISDRATFGKLGAIFVKAVHFKLERRDVVDPDAPVEIIETQARQLLRNILHALVAWWADLRPVTARAEYMADDDGPSLLVVVKWVRTCKVDQ